MTNQNQDQDKRKFDAAGALNADDAAQYLPGMDGGAATTEPPYDDSEARELIERFYNVECDPATAKPWQNLIRTPEQARELADNPPPAVVRFGYDPDTKQGYRVASAGELSMLIGGAKSRKTTFAAVMANELLKCDPAAIQAAEDGEAQITTDIENLRICFFDTEQGGHHSAKTQQRILQGLTPEQAERLTFFSLRSENNETRLRIIADVLLNMRPAPHLAIIDGLADVMTNTNDNIEAQQNAGMMMAITEHQRESAANVHIMTILHNSAANLGKGRGHAGSEWERKAETVIMLEEVKGSDSTTAITPLRTRNKRFPKMYISHTANGGSVLEADYMPPKVDDATMCATLLECAAELFPEQQKYRIDQIRQAYRAAGKKLRILDGVTDAAIDKDRKRFVEEGFLIEEKSSGKGSGSGGKRLYYAPEDDETEGDETND